MTEKDQNKGAEQQPTARPELDALSAYLAYAALSGLPDDVIESGIQTIDMLNQKQSKKIARGFSTVVQALMEVDAPVPIAAPKEKEFDPRMPGVGKQYIEGIIGSVEEYDFMVEDIPAIVNSLLQLRGAFRETKLSLDHAWLLELRLQGLSFTNMAPLFDSTPHRVKSSIYRLKEIILEKGTPEELANGFRTLIAEYDPLNPLPIPQFVKKPPVRKSQAGLKRVRPPGYLEGRRVSALRATEYDPSAFPDDLLPGETMAQRRDRLNEE